MTTHELNGEEPVEAPPILVYLASPYTHGVPEVEEERVAAADEAARLLVDMGALVYSPLSHFAYGRMRGVHPDRAYAHGLAMLSGCDAMIVLCLPGWMESEGVNGEVELADEASIPYVLLEPNGDEPLAEQLSSAMGVLQQEVACVCGCGEGEST